MKIVLDKDDMIHIAELLREDLICSKAMIDDHPLDEDAMESFLRSRKILQKVAVEAIAVNYEPTTMATRPELN